MAKHRAAQAMLQLLFPDFTYYHEVLNFLATAKRGDTLQCQNLTKPDESSKSNGHAVVNGPSIAFESTAFEENFEVLFNTCVEERDEFISPSVNLDSINQFLQGSASLSEWAQDEEPTWTYASVF